MAISNQRRLAACVAMAVSIAHAASAAEILIGDAKSQPESMTVAPGWRADRRQRQFAIRL
jgi:hypothetical protein